MMQSTRRLIGGAYIAPGSGKAVLAFPSSAGAGFDRVTCNDTRRNRGREMGSDALSC